MSVKESPPTDCRSSIRGVHVFTHTGSFAALHNRRSSAKNSHSGNSQVITAKGENDLH